MKRPLLAPLTPLYAAGLAWKNRRFDRDVGVEPLKWPVVSVGSLSAGGAGKTPVVAALVPLLRDIGWMPDILSRGYGRASKEPAPVDPNGDATEFGDEPLLLARETGVPVFVAAERVRAGRLAQNKLDMFQQHVHLLDDGFQHRQLRRDVDVVLVTRADLKDDLLPAGNLREPFESLARATALVVREDERSDVMSVIAKYIHRGVKVWTIHRALQIGPVGARPFAFCALARPDDFIATLRASGLDVAGSRFFRDHHAFRDNDMQALISSARRQNADSFITTAKDAVKLSPAMREQLNIVGPLTVCNIVATFTDADRVKADLLAVLRAKRRE